MNAKSIELAADAEKKARQAVQQEIATKASALRETEELLTSRTNALRQANETASSLRKEKALLEDEKLQIADTIQNTVEKELQAARERWKVGYEAELAKKLADRDVELLVSKEKAEDELKREMVRRDAKAERLLSEQREALKAANEDLEVRTTELAASKAIEAELLQMRRKIENEKLRMEVTIQEKVDQELNDSREQLRLEMEQEVKRQVREKDVRLESMKTEIENLKRKSEQGSQQLQGEVWERELLDTLTASFHTTKSKEWEKGRLVLTVFMMSIPRRANSAEQYFGNLKKLRVGMTNGYLN